MQISESFLQLVWLIKPIDAYQYKAATSLILFAADALTVPTIKSNPLCSVTTLELFTYTVLQASEPQSSTNE